MSIWGGIKQGKDCSLELMDGNMCEWNKYHRIVSGIQKSARREMLCLLSSSGSDHSFIGI